MLILFLILFLLFLAVTLYAADEITKIPYFGIPYTPKDFHWTFEEVEFRSCDGLKLTGWFVPARTPTDATILIQHGKGSNAGDMLLNTRALHERGSWNLLYYNFRGHGTSEGARCSLGPLELGDMESAMAMLASRHPEACRRWAIYGHSMGAAVAILGAVKHPELRGIVAESCFADTARTIKRFAWMFYRIPRFPFMGPAIQLASWRMGVDIRGFQPARVVAQISPRPLLLIVGEEDHRTPVEDARAIFEMARDPKALWTVPGAGHCQCWEKASADYEQKLLDFYRRVFA